MIKNFDAVKKDATGQEPSWIIWSNEHKAWWNPGRNGYTENVLAAGHYSFEEALEIVHKANMYRTADHEPNEAMVYDGIIPQVSE